ncbi:DUF1622 domain-containing protein [Bdellovibrio sp. 22V]|uniref:DUF1622 domain-containing protein n=1 Tax=Bdellovibrio sp. 22V TaxID=3044166 RepID=UPI00254392A6|nr:DUF1622 domain-containing protein [Bdellovibrio sp. 22V]WII72333.1 DUF1622 domain-containing protein [Bdellovibrio sp. 22V]
MVHETFRHIALIFEVAGIGVVVIGAIVSTFEFLKNYLNKSAEAYFRYRSSLGNAILLGLEFLVAGDIIGTVAVEPTFVSVGVLALIVLIRTFLSLSLGVEIHGRWPWQEKDKAPVQDKGSSL